MAFLAADASRLNPGLQYPENEKETQKTPSPKKLNYKGSSHVKRNTAGDDHSLKICPTIWETPLKELFPPFTVTSLLYGNGVVPGGLSLAEARLHWPELDTGAQREANVSIELFLLI